MSILVNSDTRLLTQGITGNAGLFHSLRCRDYGTSVVGGVTPKKGGTSVEGFPVFNTVEECVKNTGANTSMIFVPAPYAASAIMEAADAGISLIVAITEGIPVRDMILVKHYLSGKNCSLLGPNCPGVVTSGVAKVGIAPGRVHKKGCVGVISRSGTLTYEAVYQTTILGLGQSTAMGIGGDPVHGLSIIDVLEMFKDDDQTKGVIIIGEIGGGEEEAAAKYIQKGYSKPVVAFIAGVTAPPGRRMGHAGAIIEGGAGTAQSKIEALTWAGVHIAPTAAHIGVTMKKALGIQSN